MKLNKADANAWIATPPPDRPGTLIHGDDAMRVALKRQELIANLTGPDAEEEMRITRLQAADLSGDKAALADAVKAQGFFPGPRAVLVEDATNNQAKVVLAALDDWRPGDAHMVVTAKAQKPSSALRKAFESHKATACIGVYDEPMSRADIAEALSKAGLTRVDPDAQAALNDLAAALDPGDFRQLLDKLSLYKSGDETALSPEDVAACAPASTEADPDEIVAIVADNRVERIGPVMARLWSQGAQPVALCIAAQRHFRTLLTAAADPGGPGAGIGRLRPPVYGPRRDAMLRQAQHWGTPRLEQAVHLLTDTDLALRSSARAPAAALLERAFIRLAMMGKR